MCLAIPSFSAKTNCLDLKYDNQAQPWSCDTHPHTPLTISQYGETKDLRQTELKIDGKRS